MGIERDSQGFVDTRLDTWKLIAQYLGRSSRTVQRWHAGYGLPVHHLGGDASSVYAFSDELDMWLRRRNGLLPDRAGHLRPTPVVTDSQNAGGEQARKPRTSTAERESVDLVERAQRLWEGVSASNLGTIAGLYRRATDLDASNAQAYAGLSQALIAQGVLGNLHPAGAFQAAEAALRRALEIDPELFAGLCASALLKVFVERDWEGAEQLLERTAMMNPKASQPAVGRAILAIAAGRLEEARENLRRAASERPLNSSIAELECWVEYLSGRFGVALGLIEDARGSGHSGAVLDTVEALCRVALGGGESQVERLEAMTASAPRNYALLGVLGFAYGKAGRRADARNAIESMTKTGLTGVFDFAYPIALTLMGLEDRDEAQKWVEQSFRHGSLWSVGFGSDPLLADLRGDGDKSDFFGPRNYPVERARGGGGWVASLGVAD